MSLLLTLNFGAIKEIHADVVFTVIGDVPYSFSETQKLPQQLTAMDQRSAFIIHLGDIKGGGTQCEEKNYITVAGILRASIKPVFIVPGDNEWNDCKNPDLAWQYWAKYFMRFDQSWTHQFNVSRQNSHPENFSFVHKKVLFIGINIVGGRVHDKAEWKQRLAADLEWTLSSLSTHLEDVTKTVIFGHAPPGKKHKAYFNGFVKQAASFTKPILYLHGDGHHWIKNRPFKEAKNILRVQIDRKGPITVTVTNDHDSPFLFESR